MKQTGSKPTDHWIDEKGQKVPFAYINKSVIFDERKIHQIMKRAYKLSKELAKLKSDAIKLCEESNNVKRKEHNLKSEKLTGGYNITAFDNSLKIELQKQEGIIFDEMLILEAKNKLTEYVQNSLTDKQHHIGKILLSAFEKKGGKLDPKRILALNKYRSEIKDKLFQEALSLIDDASKAADSKRYVRFYEKNGDGEFKNVNLNFSSVEA